MLRRKFDFEKPCDVVLYLRMSSDKQNKNSPKQQKAQIKKVIRSRGLPWKIIKVYQDDAKTGLMTENRPGFTRMLHDIRNGSVVPKAILVDTIERFGRMDDLDLYRRRLFNENRVYVLSADRQFADPHAPEAKVMDSFENLRASEAGRIKAGDVYRGKLDSIEKGYWPGGPVPFGYALELVLVERRKGREIKHHRLVIHTINGPIMRLVFRMAAENPSWGQDALTRWLNACEQIPDALKPFHSATVGKWLRSPIYRGTLRWSDNCTGIEDGRRLVEKNDEEFVVLVEGFCEPITDADTIAKVDEGIRLRTRKDFGDTSGGAGRGVNYRYPLTGLVRCGHCGSSMVPNSSSPYKAKDGTEKVYCSYNCPRRRAGGCDNSQAVKETWLRPVVLGKIAERLLPTAADMKDFAAEIRKMILEEQSLQENEDNFAIPALKSELAEIKGKIEGWKASLADPDLHRSMRQELREESNIGFDRMEDIESILQELDASEVVLDTATGDEEIADSIARLTEAFDGQCPTRMNLELSMHIDKINCYSDGRVVMRTCKIGSTPIAIQWFGNQKERVETKPAGSNRAKTKPRRRARFRLSADGLIEGDILRDRIRTATDPHRFDSLPDDWFWVDEFQIQKSVPWVRQNAQAVKKRYIELEAETGKKPSLTVLAKEFGRSRPTISRALDIAEEGETGGQPAKHRRPSNPVKGNVELEQKIEDMHFAGRSNKEIGEVLSVSRSAVTHALDRLYERLGKPRPDGRKRRHQ